MNSSDERKHIFTIWSIEPVQQGYLLFPLYGWLNVTQDVLDQMTAYLQVRHLDEHRQQETFFTKRLV
jgi:hypothetical protein